MAFKKILKYFMECYFNQTFGYDELDKRINDFKVEVHDVKKQLIEELNQIIQEKKYVSAARFMNKYGDKWFDVEKAEKFINYLHDRLLDKPTTIKAKDFQKNCKVIFCPVCTPDPESAFTLNLIDKATIIGKDIQIYICKPCKLVWLDENDIKAENARDYKKFMKANGFKGLWKELKDIDAL
jgi:hypothetical protein